MVNFGSNRRTEREVNFFFSWYFVIVFNSHFHLVNTYPEMGAKGNFSIVLYTF